MYPIVIYLQMTVVASRSYFTLSSSWCRFPGVIHGNVVLFRGVIVIERWTAEVVLKFCCMQSRVALEASLLTVRAAAGMPLRMRATDSRTTTLHVHQENTEV